MRQAIREKDGIRVLMDKNFEKNADAYNCICCNTKVTARCGNINVWHFAHQNTPCPYSDKASSENSMSEFHRAYQKAFFDIGATCEKIFESNIADVFHNGRVYEIQHSPITQISIKNRNINYLKHTSNKVIWIIDGYNQQVQNFPKDYLKIVAYKTYIDFCFEDMYFMESIESVEDSLQYITNHNWIHQKFLDIKANSEITDFKKSIEFDEFINDYGQTYINYATEFWKIQKVWKSIKNDDINKSVKLDLIHKALSHPRITSVAYHEIIDNSKYVVSYKEALNFILKDIVEVSVFSFGKFKGKTPMFVYRNDANYYDRFLHGIFTNPDKKHHLEARGIIKKLIQ